MTPPEAGAAGRQGRAGAADSAIALCSLRRRADFLAANGGRRRATPGFVLQARRRGSGETAPPAAIRVGFTCSRRLGNAVTRNRAKRRLREIARELLPAEGRPGWDYVLIGRPGETVSRPFEALRADLCAALRRIHGTRGRR